MTMTKTIKTMLLAGVAGTVVSCCTTSSASGEKGIGELPANPFVTTIYTADPSAHVWSDGRLYVYPSHDVDPPRGCDLMDKYHVFSTDDMVHWKDHGEILNSSQVEWGRPEGGFMWAPDCASNNCFSVRTGWSALLTLEVLFFSTVSVGLSPSVASTTFRSL